MALKVTTVDVWAATIKDRPGGLAEKLDPLAAAGANLGFVIARRSPQKKASGVVFVTPLKGPKQLAAARKAGFKKSRGLRSVRVEGPDRKGLGAKLTAAIAEAGVNLRGLSAAVIAKRFVMHVALDKPADAAKVARILRKS